MTSWERAFNSLHRAQTRNLGAEVLATIGAFAVNAKAILGTVTKDQQLLGGGGGRTEAGGYTLLMLYSDFSCDPPKETSVTVNGDAAGFSLEVGPTDRANGTILLHVLDSSNET